MTDSNFALANLPIAESSTSLQDTTQTTIGSIARSLVTDDNIWAEFLKLQISEHTKRTYASALNDFFLQITGARVNPHQISGTLTKNPDKLAMMVNR